MDEVQIAQHDILFRPPFATQGQDPTVTAGLYAGGAAAIMMGLGGGLLLPLVGFAAYPVIRKRLEERALEEAKNLVEDEMEGIVGNVLTELKHELGRYVMRSFEKMETVTREQSSKYYQTQRKQLARQFSVSEQAEAERREAADSSEKEIQANIERLKQELERRI